MAYAKLRDENGFAFIPNGGNRSCMDLDYCDFGTTVSYWSSTISDKWRSITLMFMYNNVSLFFSYLQNGQYVRCIKN